MSETIKLNEETVLQAALAGDHAAFSDLVEPYRPELRVHCYRMLASFEDAEDQVQETLLRAWRHRGSFEGRSTFRAWLYRIATNACLDALKRRPRQLPPHRSAEVSWLQPFPDDLLDQIGSTESEPDVEVVARETIELAFIIAIQHLPPVQRAVFILRDVLGWRARETAQLLEFSVPATNSALQRARVTMRERLADERVDWASPASLDAETNVLVQRYIEATERADADALIALLHEESVFTMPPEPGRWVGNDTIGRSWVEGGFGGPEFRDFRCRLIWANRQPAVANYLKRPGDSLYRALAIDVLGVEGGLVKTITSFDAGVFPWFGLPESL